MRMRVFTIALGLGSAGFGLAQANGVELKAATASVKGKPEVRLRWQIAEGWIPARGLRVYRIEGAKRTLVANVAAPTDAAVDGLLPAPFRGRALAATAARALPNIPRLDFKVKRPPSRAPQFLQRKGALDQLRKLETPLITRAQRQAKLTQLQTASKLTPLGKGATRLSTNLTADALKVFSARAELNLAALLQPGAATTLGLGANDPQVAAGATVSYALHGVDAAGTESAQPIATLKDFRVGADAAPPVVAGIQFLQDEDQIQLRWDRVPAATEEALGAVSYRIELLSPGTPAPKDLTPKPLVVPDLDDDTEPEAFFENRLVRPGTYTYRVTLVDGFGRESAETNFTVPVVDWRRPLPPARASARLDVVRPTLRSTKLNITPTKIGAAVPVVPVVWTGRPGFDGMTVRYHVYRQNLDTPDAAPERLTPTPIAGQAIPFGTDAELRKAADLVLGEEFIDGLEATIQDAEADAAQADNALNRAKAAKRAAKAKAVMQATFQALRRNWQTQPPLTFSDRGVALDRRYAYSLTALYAEAAIESEEVTAGTLNIPDPKKPTSPTSPTSIFTPPVTPEKKFNDLPTRGTEFTQFVPRSPKVIGIGAGIGVDLRKSRPLPKLNLPKADPSGKVTLRWTVPSGLKDATFRIRRRVAEMPFADVGVTAKNAATFLDPVPPTRARTYEYEISTISRWGVEGSPVKLAVNVPAMIAPDAPNLLAAGPGGDGEVAVRIETPSKEQGVARLIVMRDGAEAGRVTEVAPATGDIVFTDRGRTPGQSHAYTVFAETATSKRSSASRAVSASALRLAAAPVAELRATRSAKGVALTWRAAPDAAGYVVRRRDGDAGAWIVLTPKAATPTYLDVAARTGRAYQYSVSTIDRFGNASLPVTLAVPSGT